MNSFFVEHLYEDTKQTIRIDKMLFEGTSPFQKVTIFYNKTLGHVLALDDIVQTTTKDNFIYHEMLTHVPLFAHPNPKKVLIIGAGDGGILSHVLQHKNIERAVMIEIDAMVVEQCRHFMPELSNGAFEDPRAELRIDDGIKFVCETNETFDVIIVDSGDPIGPNETLFTDEFYQNCARILTKDGMIVTQNGVPFFQSSEVTATKQKFSKFFTDVSFYVAPVPMYCGGHMALGWGAKSAAARHVDLASLEKRFAASGIQTQYYTPDIHKAAFALPPYIQKAAAI